MVCLSHGGLSRAPSGRRINPWLIIGVISDEVRKNIFVIKQYQMIQESRSKMLVKIVKGRDFDPNMIPRIKQGMEDVYSNMNEDVEVEMSVVDVIPKESSGKRPEIISLTERQ